MSVFFAVGAERFVFSASLVLVLDGLHVCLIIYPLIIAVETLFCLRFPGHFCFIVCCLYIAHMCIVSVFIELSIIVSFVDLHRRICLEVIHDNEVQLDVCVCPACFSHFVDDILSHARPSCCGTIFFMVQHDTHQLTLPPCMRYSSSHLCTPLQPVIEPTSHGVRMEPSR